LHVWQLSGAPESWEAQLRAKLAAEPVFAVISGAGGKSWAPVHRFCEAEALPCLFPNVDLPLDAESDFDDVYFSKGVLLESELIAQDVEAKRGSSSARIVQVFRNADVGQEAAATLKAAVAASGTVVIDHGIGTGSATRELSEVLRETRRGDIVVLWLRPADLRALGALPAGVSQVYMSGRMGGLEAAPLPAAWRASTLMAYPFNLPDRRRVQVDYPLGWFRIRQIPVVSEQAQADTYLACIILSDTINHMVDTFVRDYLIERMEEMLEHRILTGYYPRLALAPGQRFASKGGYLVHFTDSAGTHVAPNGEWIVP
jgi:hypothetical protein